MKTIIAALALVVVAASPTFATTSHARHLYEGRSSAYVPQSSYYYYGGSDYSPSSREQMIHAN
jgi:hypothetical protein